MAQRAADTWIVKPYTDADYLSYTTAQQHPGNGVGATYSTSDGSTSSILVAKRYSVAKTQRGYCKAILGSTVFSETPGMRQAYGTTATSGTTPDIDRARLNPTS